MAVPKCANCGNTMLALHYKNLKGQQSVCLACPICDFAGAKTLPSPKSP